MRKGEVDATLSATLPSPEAYMIYINKTSKIYYAILTYL